MMISRASIRGAKLLPSVRSLTWKTTGKRVTDEDMHKLLGTSKFLNKMSKQLPGPERIRVCPFDIEVEKDMEYPRTVYEAFHHGAKKNKVDNRVCGWIDPETEELRFLEYDQFFEESKYLSCAMQELGVKPKDFVAISWNNSKEFLECMFASTSISGILQPLYPNLDSAAVKYVLMQGQPQIFLCDTKEKARLIVDSAKEMPFLKTVIVGGKQDRDLVNDAKAAGIQMLNVNEFMNLGKNSRYGLVPPQPEDLFTLIYTSGTTGNPKGAMIAHSCAMSAFHIVNSSVGPLKPRPGTRTFCYMPTGHIYEIIFELLILAGGGTTMYWRGDVRKLIDDMRIIRPHFIPMVPRIMNRIFDGVNEKLAQSKFRRLVFNYCYNKKKKLLQKGIIRCDTIYDKLVFKKLRDLLGGRVQSMITSSAPLSHDVMEFFKVAFGCNVSELYGSTETLIVSATSPYDHTGGHLGGPFPGVQIKLIDVPELGYYAKDDCGEICIKSPLAFKGYYNNEEATKSTLVDGWVHTGDVGRWSDRETLLIIDRKKDIFKLSQGEYIAPEKVESVYARIDQIANVFVEGRGDQTFCIGIITPEEGLFRSWLKDNKFEKESTLPLEEICSDVRIRKAFLNEMRKFGTEQNLLSLHQIRNLSLETVPFTVESGLLTSTLKVKRNVAREMFSERIDELYEEGSLVDKEV